MTREQIEAWLALEGWELRQSRGCVPVYCKDEIIAFYNSDRAQYNQIRGADYFEFEIVPATPYDDERLQLIYQEIIRHEKD